MNKVRDYDRRRKLDNTVQRNMRRGSDPMDVGAAREPWEYNNKWEVGYYGYNGKKSQKEKEYEVHREDRNASRAEARITSRRTAPTRGQAKEKKEKGNEVYQEHATTAENLDIQPKSAPRRVAKAKARAKPREKEKYGK